MGWRECGVCALGLIVAVFAACVGDDAVTNSQGLPDGGVDASATGDAGGGTDSAVAESGADAGADAAEGPRCDPKKPFGTPVLMPGDINTPDYEGGFTMTADELVAVVSRKTQFGASELRYATRTSRNVPFGPADFDKVGNINKTDDYEDGPSLGASGLTIYFHRAVTAGTTEVIQYATRGTRNDPFSADQVIFVDQVALPHGVAPKISSDGLRIYFTDIDGDALYMASRSGGVGAFNNKKQVGASVGGPVLSKNELTLYYSDVSAAGKMRVATRATVNDSFPAGQDVAAELAEKAFPVHLTDDGCILYIASDRLTAGAPGGFDLYEARRPL